MPHLFAWVYSAGCRLGLAQWTGEDGETALTDTVTNRLWLAPEVLHSPEATGDGCFVVSKAADVYSFGCIMYEVLTGRLPFETDSIHQQMLEVVSGLHSANVPPYSRATDAPTITLFAAVLAVALYHGYCIVTVAMTQTVSTSRCCKW